MSQREYETLIIPCKACAKWFKLHLPIHIYEVYLAAAAEVGVPLVLSGTCPSCRKHNPFLVVMDKFDIPTLGRDCTEGIVNDTN